MANGRLNRPAGRNSNTSKQEIVIRTDRPVVVDATNHIAGRLASNVANYYYKDKESLWLIVKKL